MSTPFVRTLPLLSLIFVLPACAGSSPRAGGGEASHPETIYVDGPSTGIAITRQMSDSPELATFPAGIRQVWAALPSVYESIGVPVNRLDQVHFVIGNESLILRRRLGSAPLSRYLECGRTLSGSIADTYEVRMSILTRLDRAAEQEQTTARTELRATARPIALAGSAVTCQSTGALETRVNNLILGSLLTTP